MSKGAPKGFKESEGYDTFVGFFHSRKRNVDFTIQRKSGDNFVFVDGVKTPLKAANSLNELLLGEINLKNTKILKNKNGETKALSSRDLVHLSIIDENRISKEGPPHVGSKPEIQPSEKSLIKRLLTDVNYDNLNVIPKKQIEKAKISVSVLNELKDHFQSRLSNEVFSYPESIKASKETAEKKLQIIIPEIERDIATIGPQIAALDSKLRERQAFQAKLESYQSSSIRFQSLDGQYSADVERLQNLVSFVKHHHELQDQPCPVCGETSTKNLAVSSANLGSENDIVKAILSELEETKILQQDLLSVMDNEKRAINETQTQIEELDQEINKLFATISTIHSEFMKPGIKNIHDAISELEHFSECQLIIDQIDDYEHRIKEQQNIIEAQSEDYSPDLTLKEAKPLILNASYILEKWGFDSHGIQFSDKDQDLTINDTIRSSHGKGVRSLGCAAFMIAIMKTCLEEKRPHYSFIAIDSPLATYKGAKTEDDEKELPQGIQKTLYNGFCNLPGQIIVFDNTPTPSDIQANVIEFTKTETGRYGFFPTHYGNNSISTQEE